MKKRILSVLALAALTVSTFVGCGSASAGSTAASADGPFTVGVIQLVQHPALDAATEGFTDALKAEFGDNVTVDVQNAAGDSATCSTIANTFASQNVNLIMANATASLQAATAATNTIPVLGTSITDYATALAMDSWSGTTGINASGTSDLAPLDKQADMIKELFPDAAKVGILYCTAEPNSEYQATVITGYLKDLGYEVENFSFSDSNDIASVAQSACDNADVLYIPTDNTAASCAETINSVAIAAGKPIVAGEEGICAGCGVATLSISYYDLGFATGEMAIEILKNGADVSKMEVKYAPAVTKKYNAAICDTLGLTVPEDYVAIEQ